jgi:4,5-dihydroxyphthalate decarboxylase
MATVTYLMAKSFGKPMVLLPSVVVAWHQYAELMRWRSCSMI